MSESGQQGAIAPAVEFVPFPDAVASGPLGGAPLGDDPPPPTPWAVPAVILLAVGTAVVVAAAALGGSGVGSPGDRADRPPATSAVSVPDEVESTDPAPTSVPEATVPPTEAPVTTPETTIAPTSSIVTTTTPIDGPPPVAGGWVAYAATDTPFDVELPTNPDVADEQVQGPDGVVRRVERVVDVDDGTIGILSVPRSAAGQDPDELLVGVADAAARQLNGVLQIGASGQLGSGRYLDFAVQGPTGRLLARAVHVDGVLHLITATGPESAISPIYERVRDTFSVA